MSEIAVPRGRRLSDAAQGRLSWTLWVAVVALSALFAIVRYRAALADGAGVDLDAFAQAARALKAGHSPYDSELYVYSPLLAILLLPIADSPSLLRDWTVLSLIAVFVAIAAVVASVWPQLTRLQRPTVALIAVVTMMYNTETSIDLWFGQSDFFLLAVTALAVLAGIRRRPALSGTLLGFVAVLKTWPGGLLLWLLRAGAAGRHRAIGAAVVASAAVTALLALVTGPGAMVEWVRRTLSSSSQEWTTFSVWGAGHHLFTNSGVMSPIVESRIGEMLTSGVLFAVVLALLVVVLRRPGDPRLAMWHVTACVILVLPVSHSAYQLLVLPVLWVWAAIALGPSTRSREWWVPVGVLAVWWVLTFRLELTNDFSASGSTVGYVLVMSVRLVALTVSVLFAARLPAVAPRP